MQNAKISRIAWVLTALASLGMVAYGVVTYSKPGASFAPMDILSDITFSLFIIISAVIAAIVLSRQSRNTVGWLMLAYAVTIGVLIPLRLLALDLVIRLAPGSLLEMGLYWLGSWSWWLLIGPLLLIPLYFPEGRLPSKRWRWVMYLLLASFIFFLLVATFSRSSSDTDTGRTFTNPIGFLDEATVNLLLIPMQIGLVISTLGSVASVLYRYQRANTVEREQIKWLLFASTIFLLVYSFGFVIDPVFEGNAWYELFFNLVFIGIPLAIGVAILRYHLWDIDIIIRRTLSYSILTLLLGGLFFALVTVLQALLSSITGERSNFAILVTTLLLAALFNPLRKRIQNSIDRRFYRQKYDTQQAIEAFIASARSQTDIESLSDELLRVTRVTLQPRSISLWLHEPSPGRNDGQKNAAM